MTAPKSNPMLWVGYPKSYTPGRRRAPKLIVWHYTAGSEGPKSAEAGVAYDKIRTDGTSCHAFFDSEGPGLQEVPFGDRSHTAFFYGNEIGVHFELCGTRQTRAQWLDQTSLATLRTAAVAGRYASDVLGIEPRRLSDAEVRRAWDVGDVSGHCDHWAITRVFGLGDHTDVGTDFPWDIFMAMIKGSDPAPAPPEGDDMGVLFVFDETDKQYYVSDFVCRRRVPESELNSLGWWATIWGGSNGDDFSQATGRNTALGPVTSRPPYAKVYTMKDTSFLGPVVGEANGGGGGLIPHTHKLPAATTGPAEATK